MIHRLSQVLRCVWNEFCQVIMFQGFQVQQFNQMQIQNVFNQALQAILHHLPCYSLQRQESCQSNALTLEGMYAIVWFSFICLHFILKDLNVFSIKRYHDFTHLRMCSCTYVLMHICANILLQLVQQGWSVVQSLSGCLPSALGCTLLLEANARLNCPNYKPISVYGCHLGVGTPVTFLSNYNILMESANLMV